MRVLAPRFSQTYPCSQLQVLNAEIVVPGPSARYLYPISMKRTLLVCLLVASQAYAQEQPVTDLEARRSVRGGPVDAQPNESPELFEMRRFEERSFPRSGVFVPPPSADAEGAVPDADREDLKDIPEKLRTHQATRPAAPREGAVEMDSFLRA